MVVEYVKVDPKITNINITTQSNGVIDNSYLAVESKPKTVAIVTTSPNPSFIVSTLPPELENSLGSPGELRYDFNAVYLCVNTNFWKKLDLMNFYDPLDTVDGGDI